MTSFVLPRKALRVPLVPSPNLVQERFICQRVDYVIWRGLNLVQSAKACSTCVHRHSELDLIEFAIPAELATVEWAGGKETESNIFSTLSSS